MVVRVLAFASARDALGAAEREVTLAGGTLAELRRGLTADRPELAALWPRLAIAVDGELVGEEHQLTDGCEVALLPPVSGGEAPHVALVDGPLDVAALLARQADPRCGATVLFLGRVRSASRGRQVTAITYEAYRPMAIAALARLAVELEAAAPGLSLAVEHRLGEVPCGETSVAIAAASAHREAAFRAARAALERLKREVPIWKRERYADGTEAWREEEPLAGATAMFQPADWPILE